MSIKLLVADDSITIQKVIGIIFGGEEYSLTIVDNGKSAIEKAREICPDVLLIDALMPGMTGYEVTEAVRATPALANKPILILTGSFEPFDEDKAKKCGADDFLAKPFESQQIVNKVKELAELGATRERTAPLIQPAATVVSAPPVPPPAAFAELATPSVAESTKTPQPSAPADIWGAFTTETEAPAVPPLASTPLAAVPASAPFEFAAEPDVFAIVSEESDSQLVQPTVAPIPLQQNTGSQWIPVEEHTFEFEEEAVSDFPAGTDTAQTHPALDYAFGDIAFEDDEPLQTETATAPVSEPEAKTTAMPFNVEKPVFAPFAEPAPAFAPQLTAFEELPQPVLQSAAPDFFTPVPPPVSKAPDVSATAATVTLTEEQLKAAISAASKEVIERIVWEVVPDLAEALIKEAIRKIKEDR